MSIKTQSKITDKATRNIVDFNDLATPVWIYDTTRYRIHWANKRALALWGSDNLDELTSRDFHEGTSEAVHQTLLSYLENFSPDKTISRWWRINPNGIIKDVYCQFSGITLNDGRLAMLCEGLEMDVSQSDAFLSSAMIASTYDPEMRLLSSSLTFKEYFGNQVKEFADILVNTKELKHLIDQTKTHVEFTQDLLINTLDGQRWHSIHIRRFNQNNKISCFLVTQSDIHQRKVRELKHARQAVTDALTGLSNRYAFENKIKRLIDKEKSFTLFYIDLDGFKPINDTYGHKIGDIILQGVAKRLSNDSFAKAFVCRIGGDEFVMTVQCNAATNNHVEQIATRIVRTLSQAFEIKKNLNLSISASVGIAHYPEHGSSHQSLLASADTAMYTAKQRGRRRFAHYSPGMEGNLQRKMLLAQALPLAIEKQELSVHYQPIVNTTTGRVEMVEGLIRWHSNRLGEITAIETIECAEDIGLIAIIETWVINQACHDLPLIRETLGQQVRLTINISGRHLMESEFTDTLNNAVKKHNLMTKDLIIELTEGTLIPAAEQGDGPAHTLKKMGYQIAIDDFGTGYSSLAYLHSFPASYVKIDKAFVERIREDATTVSCINHLVSTLGMISIAEGVEQADQLSLLVDQDVKLQQGYWFSHPMSLNRLITSFNTNKLNSWAIQ